MLEYFELEKMEKTAKSKQMKAVKEQLKQLNLVFEEPGSLIQAFFIKISLNEIPYE